VTGLSSHLANIMFVKTCVSSFSYSCYLWGCMGNCTVRKDCGQPRFNQHWDLCWLLCYCFVSYCSQDMCILCPVLRVCFAGSNSEEWSIPCELRVLMEPFSLVQQWYMCSTMTAVNYRGVISFLEEYFLNWQELPPTFKEHEDSLWS
jgi:hypothetical protein